MTSAKPSRCSTPHWSSRHRVRVRKLDPRVQWRNPVMFVVYVGSILTTLLWRRPGRRVRRPGFILAITVWLWFTVLFANFARRWPRAAARRRPRRCAHEEEGHRQEAGAAAHGSSWHRRKPTNCARAGRAGRGR